MENFKEQKSINITTLIDYTSLTERPKPSHKQRKLIEDCSIRLKYFNETGKLLPSSIMKKRKPKKVKIKYFKKYFIINKQIRTWTKNNYEDGL